MTSANSNQKAGFSFGAAVNSNPAAPSAQTGFNFGAAAPAPSSGGFNFTGAVPTFNAGAKPSFNFTDGSMATFTAQPSADSGLPAPRKIKRAVRRTQR
ncbi:hypothetical protein NQ318_008212 [Aromia moschata]|uniref:Uncharacterized protein n=1 Tax=Aromia moschata TaxID=1265417 RepID=A0AAV8YJZ8_9CUCU|nr:hypothetical protein NQ318_008212 [Aromia moschata]